MVVFPCPLVEGLDACNKRGQDESIDQADWLVSR